MSAQRYELMDAFSIRGSDGRAIVFPPSVVKVQPAALGVSVSIGNHEPVFVPPHEFERLVAGAVALPN